MTLPSHQQYKDSGTQWLGKVPSHWETQRVKRLFEIKKRIVGECGFDVLSITQQGIKVKDIESNDGQLSMDYSKYQLVEVGDFAMNHMDLLTGYVDISISEGVTSPDYRVFTIKNENTTDSKYFLYLFQNGYKRKIFYAFGQGASQFGRWRMPTEQFNDFLMPFPPVNEQKSIVQYLDKETAKIDALIVEQINLVELLKEKRQGIISHAVTKGLNPKAKMKDSGVEWLGEVPEGWDVRRLKYNLRLLTEKTDRRDCPIALENIEGWTGRYIPTETEFQGEGIAFIAGDILFGKLRPYLAKAYVAETSGEAVGDLHVMRPNSGIESRFAQYQILNREFIAIVDSSTFGSKMPRASWEFVAGMRVTMPSLIEQIQIVEFINSETAKIDNLIEEASKASELLKERRSALISAAVTGKIDIRGAK